MTRKALVSVVVVAAALSLAPAAPAVPNPLNAPLGIPIPTNVTLQQLVSPGSSSGDVRGTIPGADACASAPRRAISLPADEAPHNDAEIDSWWWYGHLNTEDGHRLAFQLSFVSKPWAHLYEFDSSIEDLSNGTFHYARDPLNVGQPTGSPVDGSFSARSRHASAVGANGTAKLNLAVDGYTVQLSVRPNVHKPPVLAFDHGYFNAYCQTQYLYVRVRMPTVGTVTHNGQAMRVTGTGTLQRNWGFLPAEQLGLASWDWLTFQLKDGRDLGLIVVAPLRSTHAVSESTGYISDATGQVTTLHASDFTITPVRFWHPDATCAYPVGWDVTVNTGTTVQPVRLHLHSNATVDASELRGIQTPAIFALWPSWSDVWDGETQITGDGTGVGWVDASGYCLA